jgi:hypothetical protein
MIQTFTACLYVQLFEFADKYRGRYDNSITVARNYYGSHSGYGVAC